MPDKNWYASTLRDAMRRENISDVSRAVQTLLEAAASYETHPFELLHFADTVGGFPWQKSIPAKYRQQVVCRALNRVAGAGLGRTVLRKKGSDVVSLTLTDPNNSTRRRDKRVYALKNMRVAFFHGNEIHTLKVRRTTPSSFEVNIRDRTCRGSQIEIPTKKTAGLPVRGALFFFQSAEESKVEFMKRVQSHASLYDEWKLMNVASMFKMFAETSYWVKLDEFQQRVSYSLRECVRDGALCYKSCMGVDYVTVPENERIEKELAKMINRINMPPHDSRRDFEIAYRSTVWTMCRVARFASPRHVPSRF